MAVLLIEQPFFVFPYVIAMSSVGTSGGAKKQTRRLACTPFTPY